MDLEKIMARNSDFMVVNDVARSFLQYKKDFKQGIISESETNALVKALLVQLRAVSSDLGVVSNDMRDQVKNLSEEITNFGKRLKDGEIWIGD